MCRRAISGCVSAGGGPVIPVARRPGVGAEILLPNTGPVAVNAGTPFGTWGAWTAIVTPANDTFLTRLQARREAVPGALMNMGVEFGYGAGPTSLDIVRGVSFMQDPNAEDTGYYALDLNTYNTKIPAGAQLKARASDGAAAQVYDVWACGWDTAVPTFTALTKTSPAGAGRYYPTNVSTGLNVNAAAFPAWGAWAQVVAAAPNDMLVTAVHCAFSVNNVVPIGIAYQVGIGGAGSEKEVATTLQGHAEQAMWIDPPVWVLAGERLAVRATAPGAGGKLTIVKVIDL